MLTFQRNCSRLLCLYSSLTLGIVSHFQWLWPSPKVTTHFSTQCECNENFLARDILIGCQHGIRPTVKHSDNKCVVRLRFNLVGLSFNSLPVLIFRRYVRRDKQRETDRHADRQTDRLLWLYKNHGFTESVTDFN